MGRTWGLIWRRDGRRRDSEWSQTTGGERTSCGLLFWQCVGGRSDRTAEGDVGRGGASSPTSSWCRPPPMPLILALCFSLLLLVTWLLNAKNCGSHAVRRPLPRFLLLAFYTPITGLRSSVGVSLQLLVCSDAQRCLIFDEALFINQPPPLPPVATWQIFIGKTSRKTRRSWEAVHQNGHALFFVFHLRKEH